MSHPRLLFVLNTLEIGGSESKIVKVVNALSKSGSAAEIAYLNPPEPLRRKIDPSVRVTHVHRRGKYSFRAVRELTALVGERDCVLVAVNLYPLLYAIPAAGFPSSQRAPVVGLINTALESRRLRLVGRLYAQFLRRCDRVVYGCESQLRVWTKRHRLPVENADFIYNGVDDREFSPDWCPDAGAEMRERAGIPSKAMVFGSVGRLAPEKNFDLLVSAVARLNGAGRESYLVIAGDGVERPGLLDLASALGISEKVRLLGSLDDVRPALAMMDVFVLPSREVETFSNAALEAMAMALPVVLSEIGGAAEMVDDKISGLLFRNGDFVGLCDTLTRLHDSRELREQLGQAARRRILGSFTFTRMVDRYRALADVGIRPR